MRLTPFGLGSSTDESDGERSEDDESPEVTIYHNQVDGDTTPLDSPSDVTSDFVPESDSALLAVLEQTDTPATVDSVVDRLTEPAEPSIETWAAVHERLHDERLPELDASGAIEFDADRGTVETVEARSTQRSLLTAPLVGVALVSVLFIVLVAWLTSTLTALTFTFVVVMIVAWFVPVSGVV
ncbi:hypothetical protein [Natrarchaeobius oligotrophus]|uniref:Uncharacterized protein n=1 Tax=Natrarchaeobius chitinivorans TaxID=1679083 RepID=A0A3N6M6Y4_NATCH|nr:hypothetical protein [Natrarchaeobius chitinivorans]RQG99363.1 hypothetical protein EA472_14140 [Natrarchaeobius chitinivorans]